MLTVMAILGLPKAMELGIEEAREYASSGDFGAARYHLELCKEVVNSEIDAIITELDGAEKVIELLKSEQQ